MATTWVPSQASKVSLLEIRESLLNLTAKTIPIEETGFVTSTRGNPLSTFGIDVDTATTNLQRVVTSGYSINPDAVHIEELVNYFDYGYEGPKGEVPFEVGDEVAPCPWNPRHLLARVPPESASPQKDLPPMNLVFLIDTSGSMEDELPLIKSGFRAMLEVNPAANRSRSRCSTPTRPDSFCHQRGSRIRAYLGDALNRLTADGYTAGGEGIQLAYRVAQEQHETGTMSRVLLATDGDFNVGIQSEGELQRLIEDKRKSGIFLAIHSEVWHGQLR